MKQLAEALYYIHTLKVYHRDIKVVSHVVLGHDIRNSRDPQL